MNITETSTAHERILGYLAEEDYKSAHALSLLVAYLSDCFKYDIIVVREEEE